MSSWEKEMESSFHLELTNWNLQLEGEAEGGGPNVIVIFFYFMFVYHEMSMHICIIQHAFIAFNNNQLRNFYSFL
jgi:hypothetical protein